MATVKALPGVFRQALSEWINDNAPWLGASITFYTLLSLAPVIVIAGAVAAVLYGNRPPKASSRWKSEASPGQVAQTIQEIVRGAYRPGQE